MKPRYRDLEDYGIIGNLETCALVSRDGSIDWLCFPYLESPSLFAAILDVERGGHFWIKPVEKYEAVQSYIENTNILQTNFTTSLGVVVVTDFMKAETRKNNKYVRAVFRKVECMSGEVELEVSFEPRFNYARLPSSFEPAKGGIVTRCQDESLFLQSQIPLDVHNGKAEGTVSMKKGEAVWFVLHYNHHNPLRPKDCEKLLRKVKKFWERWTHRCMSPECVIDAPWHDLVVRSGLILKLLTNPDSGAIAAAPTTSIPEIVGGVRNWDYRYAWVRDASFTVQALFHLGHLKESLDFRRWMEGIVRQDKHPSELQIMYGLHGEADLEERVLENLSGYKNSRPVRIGNGAAKQKQLDIYGEMLNSIYETTRYGEEISHETWRFIKGIVDHVCQVWDTEDSGIWEVRGGPRHFVYSKLMCWVAVDRGIRISELKGFDAPLERWKKVRGAIKKAMLKRGFSKKLNSFVQSFGSETLDATSLLIPIVGFLPFEDSRVQGTIDAILKRLMIKDGLVYRYESEDGLLEKEGCFVLCSFWLVKALALSGKVEPAEKIFLNVLNYMSPLGLFAEEIDPKTGKLLGNFPQAFSHIGLINSALYLGIAKGRKHKGPKLVGVLNQEK